VKYPKPIIGNDIIQDINQVRLSVKTDKQMFVFRIGIVFVKKTVVFDGVKCQPYVYLAHAVFESGGIELYGNIHVSILLQKKRSRNEETRERKGDRRHAGRGRELRQKPCPFALHSTGNEVTLKRGTGIYFS
jgi:hypothetical protein